MQLPDHTLLQILSQSSDATTIYGTAELHIHFVNKAMLDLWGKNGDVTGKILEEVLPELEGQPFAAILKEVWNSGKTYAAKDTPANLIKNGKLVRSYFDFEYRPIFDSGNQVIAILHTAKDVSDRHQAMIKVEENHQRELDLIQKLTVSNDDFRAANQKLQDSNDSINILNLRLQESETDFKRLVEQAPVAILVFRGENLVIDIANHAMLEILDKDATIIGLPILEAMPELRGEPAVDLLFDVYHTGRVEEGMEVPVRMKRDGVMETRFFNFSYRPLYDHGKIVGVMDVAVEVTAQVEAQQTLRASEQRLQGILDTMAEGVVIVDKSGMPTYANETARKIMGVTEKHFAERHFNDERWQNERIDGTPMPMEEHPVQIVLKEGRPVYDHEIASAMASGEKKYLSVNAAPLYGEGQQVIGGIATFTDVTQRRLLMQQKDDFISVASHELKTPITSLKASIQLLDRMKHDVRPEMLIRLIEQSNRSLNKLSELVASLLNTNRISQGRFPLNQTSFVIGNMLAECCQQVRPTTGQHIELNGALETEIFADEQLLEQVVVNFLNNAIKYAPNGKKITVNAAKAADHLKISVNDEGPGVDEGKLPHIFERYYRADHGGLQFSGLGLGLFIAAEIIAKHDGRIGVESLAGQGASFWFTIPLDSSLS